VSCHCEEPATKQSHVWETGNEKREMGIDPSLIYVVVERKSRSSGRLLHIAFQLSPQRSKDRKGLFVQSYRRALSGIELFAKFEVALTLG